MRRSTQKMVGFLRLCQHFAKKKREMESLAADIKRPPPTGRGQVVVRSSSEKSRRPPPKVDQSVQCSVQQSVQESVQADVMNQKFHKPHKPSVQESVKDGRVDVSEEEERELEKRLLKLQELLGDCDEGESESEDNFDVEIASALRGVDRELEERKKLTDLVVVSSETAAVFTVDVALITDRQGTKSTRKFSTGSFLRAVFLKMKMFT